MTLDGVSSQFPDAPIGYFDNAAVGTAPRAVQSAVAEVARALARGTVGSPDWHAITDEAPALLARDLGVPAEAIEFLANTSEAFNFAARAVSFGACREVLTFSDDFPSPRMGWRGLPEVSVREVVPGADRTESLISAISSETKVASVTHVNATTGAVVDLEKVHAATSAAGVLLMVDGTQAGGLLPDAAAHADVYVSASYKWLLAGFGSAVVATSERFRAQATPQILGYMNPAPSASLAVGHQNLYGIAALAAAARVRHDVGLDGIRHHTVTQVRRIAARARELGLTPATARQDSGILALNVSHVDALVAELQTRGLTVARREGKLRISPYLTTTDQDVERLLDALADLAPNFRSRGEREDG